MTTLQEFADNHQKEELFRWDVVAFFDDTEDLKDYFIIGPLVSSILENYGNYEIADCDEHDHTIWLNETIERKQYERYLFDYTG